MQRADLTITTNADGDGIGYIGQVLNGHIWTIRYVKDDYDNGVGVVISGETSGIEILTLAAMNASVTKNPRGNAHEIADGTDSEYTGQDQPVKVLIPLANERIKVVVSAGGDTKSGMFHFWIG